MNKHYSTEMKLVPTKHIMDFWWPRDSRSQNIRVSKIGIVSKYFQTMLENMRLAQIQMIKFHMPSMNEECKRRAKRTLRLLENKNAS